MARKGQGILLVYTDLIEPKYEEEFNAWYNTEHVPELLAIPGVLEAARYVATRGGPKYLAAYELASVDVPTPEFKNRPRTPWGRRRPNGWQKSRTHCGAADLPVVVENPDRGMAPALQIGRMSVPESVDAEWNAWYNGEYIPVSQSPGALFMRGVSVSSRAKSTIPPCMNSSTIRSRKP